MRTALVIVAAAGLVSCGGKSPTAASDPIVSGLQILGPSEVPPGEIVQFKLIAVLSDGNTRDLTNEASWSSRDARLVTIEASGRATGHERGVVTIVARFDQQEARRELYVLPAGTYRIAGIVMDRSFPNHPLMGVRIEVTSDTGAGGLVATSDADGVFFLYGISDGTTIRVTKEGYSSVTEMISATEHRWISLTLSVLGNRPDLSGAYTLTIAAASECATGPGEKSLPPEARMRSYSAYVQQDGATLWVTLNGGGRVFYGYVEPAQVAFFIRNPDDGTPISETISASRVLFIEGRAVGPVRATGRIDGVLSGKIEVLEIPGYARVASCASANHQFLLSR